MSRIGEKIINVPDGVSVEVQNSSVNVKGPLGAETISLLDGIELKIEDNILTVVKKGDETDKKLRAFHGLSRALIANMVTGVSVGFKKELEIIENIDETKCWYCGCPWTIYWGGRNFEFECEICEAKWSWKRKDIR